MARKYIIISFALVGLVFAYPFIQSKFNLPASYSSIVVIGFLALTFIITPLYWKAIVKQGKKDKEKYSRAKQPWE